MPAFQNEFTQHESNKEITREFKNIEGYLQRLIATDANRAPKTEDKQLIWIYVQASTVSVYVKHPKTGAYIGPL
jgi:hypothetical protein